MPIDDKVQILLEFETKDGLKEIQQITSKLNELPGVLKQIAQTSPFSAIKRAAKLARIEAENLIKAGEKVSQVKLSPTGGKIVTPSKTTEIKAAEKFAALDKQFSQNFKRAEREARKVTDTLTKAYQRLQMLAERASAKAQQEANKRFSAAFTAGVRQKNIEMAGFTKLNQQRQKMFDDLLSNLRRSSASAIGDINRKVAAEGQQFAGDAGKRVDVIQGVLAESIKKAQEEFAKTGELTKDFAENLKFGMQELIKDQKTAFSTNIRDTKKAQGLAGRAPSTFANLLKSSKGQLGTIAFSTVQFGDQLTEGFRNLRLSNVLGPVFSDLAGIAGKLFGNLASQIAADLGSAFGKFSEAAISLGTAAFRIIGVAFAGLIKGLGKALLATVLTGAVGATGVIGGLVTALGTTFLLTFDVLLNTVKQIFNEIAFIVKSVFSAITDIVKAGLRLVVGIVQAFDVAIKNLWNGIWESIKSIVKASLEVATQVIKTFVAASTTAFNEYINLQLRAAQIFSEVVDIAAETNSSINIFEREINRVRATFGLLSQDVSKSLFDVVSAGFTKAADRLKILEGASRLAIAGEATLEETTGVLIATMYNFGKQGEDVESLLYKLNAGAGVAVATMGEFANGLRNVSGTAALAGFSFDDTAIALAALTRALGPGSAQRAGTFLNRALEVLQGEPERFAELGINVQRSGNNLRDLVGIFRQLASAAERGIITDVKLDQLFGTAQARRAIRPFLNDIGLLDKTIEEFQGKATKENFEKAFKTVFGTTQIQINRIKQGISIIVEKYGKFLNALLTPADNALTKIADSIFMIIDKLDEDRVNKFFESFSQFAKPVVDEILNPMLNLLTNIGTMIEDIDFENMFNTPELMTFRDQLVQIVKNVKEGIDSLIDWVKNSELVQSAWEKIKSAVEKVWELISSENPWETIRSKIDDIRTQFSDVFSSVFSNFAELALTAIDGFIEAGKRLFPLFGQFIVRIFDAVWKIIAALFVAYLEVPMKKLALMITDAILTGIRRALSYILDTNRDVAGRQATTEEFAGFRNVESQFPGAVREGFSDFGPTVKEAIRNEKGELISVKVFDDPSVFAVALRSQLKAMGLTDFARDISNTIDQVRLDRTLLDVRSPELTQKSREQAEQAIQGVFDSDIGIIFNSGTMLFEEAVNEFSNIIEKLKLDLGLVPAPLMPTLPNPTGSIVASNPNLTQTYQAPWPEYNALTGQWEGPYAPGAPMGTSAPTIPPKMGIDPEAPTYVPEGYRPPKAPYQPGQTYQAPVDNSRIVAELQKINRNLESKGGVQEVKVVDSDQPANPTDRFSDIYGGD